MKTLHIVGIAVGIVAIGGGIWYVASRMSTPPPAGDVTGTVAPELPAREPRRESGRSDTEAVTDVIGGVLREVGQAYREHERQAGQTERERLALKGRLAEREAAEHDDEHGDSAD